MTTILITGHTGFIGSHLCKRLSKSFTHLIGLSTTYSLDHNIKQYVGSINDNALLKKIFNENLVTHIVNLAGDIGERKSNLTKFNLEPPNFSLFETAARCDTLEKFVQVGSTEEYGHSSATITELDDMSPVNAYAFRKACETEHIIKLNLQDGFPGVVLRPTIVYGPRQRPNMFIPSLIDTLLRNRVFSMSPGTQRRDFIYIDDMIEAINGVLEVSKDGEVYNVSSEEPTALIDIVDFVCSIIGSDCDKLIRFDKNLATDYGMRDVCVSSLKLRQTLGWKPTYSIQFGLNCTINYFREMCA